MNRIQKSLLLGLFATLCSWFPASAAEKVLIVFGPLKFSLGVDAIASFANEGTIDRELAFYVNALGLNEARKSELRKALRERYEINPVYLSRFLNTPTGEQLLERIGNLLSLPGGRNGKYLVRGALVSAALDKEEGLSIVNFLRHLAVDIQLNMTEIITFLDYQNRVNLATRGITEEAERLTGESAENPTDYATIPDIRQPGEYGVKPVEIWQLKDEKRARSLYVHFYFPEKNTGGKIPVVVVSHGLASRPEDFRQLGQQLASHGFAVAIPQHPGSDFRQFESMLTGYSRLLYDRQEFIDRPLDITYVLDELERRNPLQFGGKLDVNRAGVLGHSFGGYTALAVAGATWDFENIRVYCDRAVWEANLSMLLQCDLLNLPRKEYNFRDERVRAIGLMNPVNTVVFGARGLEKVRVPVVIGAGTNDPATPLIIEQVRTMTWANTADKHLFLIVGQAHFLSPIEDNSIGSSLLTTLKELEGMNLDLVTLYGNTQATAFLGYYLAENPEYRVFLKPGYWRYISTPENPIYWLDRSSVEPLTAIYNRFKPADIPTLVPNKIQPIP